MKRVVSGVEREPVAIDSGHTVANTTGSHRRSYTLHQPPPPPHVLYSCTKDRSLSVVDT